MSEGATSEGAREGRGGIIMEVLCKWAYGPDVEIARKINASEGEKRGDFHYVGWKLAGKPGMSSSPGKLLRKLLCENVIRRALRLRDPPWT